MRSTSSSHEATSVSRRSFIKLTMGSIVLLPTVANALLLPSEIAHAADGEQRAPLVGSSTIYVVSTHELGIIVRDVTIADDSANLIVGAYVKITSHFNGKMVDGTTDDKGAIHFDITELAEDEGKNESPARFLFNAAIEIEAPRYRKFCAKLIRLTGGTALGVPTQPRQDGIPYPKSASFDDWDVLYTTGDATTFVSCAGNDAAHTIDFDLEDCPAGAAIAAGIYVDGEQVVATNVQATSDGTASVAFSDTFLFPDSSAALPTGDSHAYTMRYAIGDTTYEVPIKPTVVEAPPEAQNLQLEKDLELTPFNDTTMFLGITVPESWPIIGGHKLKLWEPTLWYDIAFDPFGFIRIKATTPAWGYVRKDGKKDEHAWKFHPRDTAKEQYSDLKKSIAERTSDTFGSVFTKEGRIKQIGFTHTLSFTVQAEFMAAAVWSFDDEESRGRASVGLRIGANYSLMETFWAGPIPMVVRFSFGLNTSAVGEVGFISPSIWKVKQYRWDWTSTGFDLQICLSPTLSVGVGIGGVCSISFKGTFALTFSVHEGPLPAGYKDKPRPHVRLAGYAMASVEVEFLLFTDSYKLWDHEWPNWINNWETDTLKEAVDSAAPAQKLRLGEALNHAKIITSESLAALAEFSTTGVAGMNAKETKLTRYALIENGASTSKTIAQLFLSDDEALEFEEASNAMAAQDDAEVTYTLKASNDQVSRWETTIPQASEVGEHDYVTIPAGEAPGVLSLGKETGIRPTTDMRIANNILSSSRFKLFTTGGKDYMARIGVVLVNGKVRTRIIAERIDTGVKSVLDFQTSSHRDECFDYDFAVSTVTVNGVETVNLVVISGTREQDDATTLSHAASKTFFSFLTCWNWDDTRPSFSGTTVNADNIDAIGLSKSEYPFRNYSCPQIVQIMDGFGGWIEGQSVVTYLERAGATEQDVMGDDPERTKVGVGLLFFNDRNHTPFITGMDLIRKAVTSINDPSITEITFHNRVNGWHYLMLKGSEQTYYVVVSTHACAAQAADYTFVPKVLSANVVDLGELASKIERLIPAPSGKYFLTCLDGKLKRVDVKPTGNIPRLEFTDIGTEDLNICDFGITSGDVLYWPASRENGGYTFDGDGDATLREDDEGKLYLLMGARIRNNKLSRAFPLCEVSHPMHRIRSYGNTNTYMSFISSITVDATEGKGEQWYTAVPWVRCATLLDAAPNATLFAKGDRMSFYLTLRNDGNCYLSAVDLTVKEVGGAIVGTIRLDFLKSTTLESEWNPRGEDGELTNVEDDWMLAPGTTSRYYAADVTIPETWEGEHEVEIFVSAAYAGTLGEMVAQEEEESIEFIPDRHVPVLLAVSNKTTAANFIGEYDKADITVIKPTLTADSTAALGTSANTANSTSQRSTTPKTGDPLSAAMLALGGAAGLAAYGVYRSREEQESGCDE